MSTITVLGQVTVPKRQVAGFIARYWKTFQERREREKVRAALYALDVRDLQDIGIGHGEIEYVASNRSVDPRGALSPQR